ncbi:STAS domain-containing protein [Streptomyces sp. NPDC059355]|uniref:STAS domain-containing protein n=1 Tax=Streptomyces sp. NPDC059355 TaxID=3346811 RepID=UPI0036A28774
MPEHPHRKSSRDIAVEILDHSIAVRPTGEIDIDTAPTLQLALAEALTHASPARPVVIDCSSLTFCDSSALNALLAARRIAQPTGTAIRLAAPNLQLHRLLELTGTLALFPLDQDPPADGRRSQWCGDGLPQ